MSDRLTALLADVGRDIDWPEYDVAPRVTARLRAAPPRRAGWLPRVAFAAAAAVVLATATLVFSPATRRAVADLLGIGGVRIEYGTPTATPHFGSGFDLGEPVTLEQAQAAVDFDVRTIDDPQLGAPDGIYLDGSTPAGPMVAFVYRPRPGLPVGAGRDVALIFTQFEAALAGDEFFFKKVPVEGTEVQGATVGGDRAYWLEGEPHVFYYEAPPAGIVREEVRLVGNVLLWEDDDLTLRLEVGDLSLARALRIAERVRS